MKKTPGEPSEGFNYAKIFASDEGIDPEAVSHGLTRNEAEQGLRHHTKAERALVLACVFDTQTSKRPSGRRLAETVGKSKSWVAVQLKRGTIKQAIANTRSGKGASAAKTESATTPKATGKPRNLRQCDVRARGVLTEDLRLFDGPGIDCDLIARGILREGAFGSCEEWDENQSTPPALLMTSAIRSGPATLLNEKSGPLCVRALVDLLEAATLGDSKRRVPGIVPMGTRQQVRTAARKALAILTRQISGRPFEHNRFDLMGAIMDYRVRLGELRAEWKASAEPIPVRFEIMRERHKAELRNYTGKELPGIFQGDPFDTLDTASRLAEKATGLSAETWARAWKTCHLHILDLEKRFRQKLKEKLGL